MLQKYDFQNKDPQCDRKLSLYAKFNSKSQRTGNFPNNRVALPQGTAISTKDEATSSINCHADRPTARFAPSTTERGSFTGYIVTVSSTEESARVRNDLESSFPRWKRRPLSSIENKSVPLGEPCRPIELTCAVGRRPRKGATHWSSL